MSHRVRSMVTCQFGQTEGRHKALTDLTNICQEKMSHSFEVQLFNIKNTQEWLVNLPWIQAVVAAPPIPIDFLQSKHKQCLKIFSFRAHTAMIFRDTAI